LNLLTKIKTDFQAWLNKNSQDEHPLNFSFQNWLRVFISTLSKTQKDNISLLAAGIAFYFLLALFPMLAAMVSLYSLFVNDVTISQHMEQLAAIIPSESRYIIEEQIAKVNNVKDSTLSTGFVSGLLFTVYSAGKGATALIIACNITYKERDNRGFFFALLQRILLTLTIMLTIIAYLLIIIILPIILDNISASQFNESLIKLASWAFLLISSFGLLGLLYKYAPDRHSAKWRWVSPGAFVAGILWLLGSYAFNMYVSHFGAYNETYGSVGGIIILLMWFYMTAFIVLIGAEINASSELHTSEDTTIGPNQPIGERGAFVADNTKTD
jgi:membrane protein